MHAILNHPKRVLQTAAAIFVLIAYASDARADIFQWEYVNPADPSQGKRQSSVRAPDGAGVNAIPGAYLAGRDLTLAYMIGANLTNANLASKIEDQGSGWIEFPWGYERFNFIDFRDARLTDADFTGADVRGASFSRGYCPPDTACTHYNPGGGITLAQLYSTASYQARDLSGINLSSNDLAGANFAGQNLTNAVLGILTGADLTAADARGAWSLNPSGAITTNLIRYDGHIDGLDVDADALLVVHDYDGRPEYGTTYPSIPITVDQHLVMGPGGTLRMVFEADAWDSTISFAQGIPVTLGGTLELTFAADVNLTSQVGRTFNLFNWTGVDPTGRFAISSPYAWDLSNLYTTGEVTLTAVPEPANAALAAAIGVVLLRRRRRRKSAVVHAQPQKIISGDNT